VAPKRRGAKRLRLPPLVLALAGATCLSAASIAASIVGGRGLEAAPTATADGSVTRNALFAGIPQDGIALGCAT
jgi:hypothetical protein